jgi:hypothetical protein
VSLTARKPSSEAFVHRFTPSMSKSGPNASISQASNSASLNAAARGVNYISTNASARPRGSTSARRNAGVTPTRPHSPAPGRRSLSRGTTVGVGALGHHCRDGACAAGYALRACAYPSVVHASATRSRVRQRDETIPSATIAAEDWDVGHPSGHLGVPHQRIDPPATDTADDRSVRNLSSHCRAYLKATPPLSLRG